MNKEELRSFIDNYETVDEKIRHVFEVLQTVDYWHWTTGKGILHFTIEKNVVYITYNDSSMGCFNAGSSSISANWLLLSDEKLIEIAKQDKIERDEKEKRKKEEKQKIEAEEREQHERDQYEKLKAKFGE